MSAVVDVVDEGAKATAGGFGGCCKPPQLGFGAKPQENFEFGPYKTLKSFNLTRFLNGKRQRFHDRFETSCNYNQMQPLPLLCFCMLHTTIACDIHTEVTRNMILIHREKNKIAPGHSTANMQYSNNAQRECTLPDIHFKTVKSRATIIVLLYL